MDQNVDGKAGKVWNMLTCVGPLVRLWCFCPGEHLRHLLWLWEDRIVVWAGHWTAPFEGCRIGNFAREIIETPDSISFETWNNRAHKNGWFKTPKVTNFSFIFVLSSEPCPKPPNSVASHRKCLGFTGKTRPHWWSNCRGPWVACFGLGCGKGSRIFGLNLGDFDRHVGNVGQGCFKIAKLRRIFIPMAGMVSDSER